MNGIEPEALGELYDAHAAALTLYARQLCDCPDDVVQDAFIQLARQRRCPLRPAAWLYTVVRHGAISAQRSAHRRRRREHAVAAENRVFAPGDDPIDGRLAAERLQGLDPLQREVIVARIWGNLTFEEIARLQGCSVATAFRRYREGLSRLQESLEPSCTRPTS